MGFQDIYSYVVYDNPLSKGVTNATKSVLSGVSIHFGFKKRNELIFTN